MDWHSRVKGCISPLLKNEVFSTLENTSITILGGTGFIGKWIVSALLEAKMHGNTNVEINLVSRNPKKVFESFPDAFGMVNVLHKDFLKSDEKLQLPFSDSFIYAATPTKPSSGLRSGPGLLSEATNGINLVLDAADKYQNQPRVIHLSSGIVYGTRRSEDLPIRETNDIEIQETDDSYYLSKIAIERILTNATNDQRVRAANPRLFAFAGPGLSINEHFAVGNFMADLLADRDIKILGNPNSARSYMHPVDLLLWIFSILNNPTLDPINVGSNKRISMLELADAIRELSVNSKVIVQENDSEPSFYYPETLRAQLQYGLHETVDLQSGLRDWLQFLKNEG